MENNEKKINAVELNDENLENVSGGEQLVLVKDTCPKCGWPLDIKNMKSINGIMYCGPCSRLPWD